MPKDTFYNLSEEKQEKIIACLRETFKNKPFYQVSVSEIVDDLNIARGSFYQYFENLEEAYYFILDRETIDVHKLFLEFLKENKGDPVKALEAYGKAIADTIFEDENYSIYKNRFLYRSPKFEQDRKAYKAKEASGKPIKNPGEKIQYLKALVHNLIQRNFIEGRSKKEFINHYNEYLERIRKGIENGNN